MQTLLFAFFLYGLSSARMPALQSISVYHPKNAQINNTRTLSVPSAPPSNRPILDANFQSYSIEFSYMLDYGGNITAPNHYSQQLMQHLYDISGAYPIIRAGGTTQNRAVFVANQSQALITKFSPGSPDQPSALTIGPTWIESFQTWPDGTQFIYGLNFQDGDTGLQQTVLEANNAFQSLGDSLYAFEIGNEVDGWPCSSRRPCNWTIISYVDQWRQFAAAITDQIIKSPLNSPLEPLFQGCAFEAPRHLGYNVTPFWNAGNAVALGMASTGKLKSVADHDYMGSNCAGAVGSATIAGNLLNHYRMTSLMYYHEVIGNYTASVGIPYVLGETNSISCQGAPNVSDVYAAALWSVDYTLYVAGALQIQRMYYHQGTPYRYSAWQPVTYNSTMRNVKPLYYGNLFTATAFAGGNKQVSVLVNETDFTAYGVYDATSKNLTSVAIVNLAMWNSTQESKERPYIGVKLPAVLQDSKVKRLTGVGVDVRNDITFAGQRVDDETGEVVGDVIDEAVSKDGSVLVGAGEAVLVVV